MSEEEQSPQTPQPNPPTDPLVELPADLPAELPDLEEVELAEETGEEVDEDEGEYVLSWSERLGAFTLQYRAIIFWLILALALVLRLWRLEIHPATITETYTIFTTNSELSWFDLLGYSPIYHSSLITNIVLGTPVKLIGFSVWGSRFLPAIFGVVEVAAIYGLAKELFGSRTALLAILFAAISPYQIIVSQQFTPEVLAGLLGTCMVWTFYEAWRRDTTRSWTLFALVTLLALYNLPSAALGFFSLTLFFVLALYVQVRATGRSQGSRLKNWLLANLIIGLGCLFWLMLVLSSGWGTVPAFDDRPSLYDFLQLNNIFLLTASGAIGSLVGLLLLVFMLNAVRFRLRRGDLGRQRRSFEISLMLTYWFVSAALLWIMAVVFGIEYSEFNLIGIAAPSYILLARVIQTSRKPARWLILLIPALLVIISVLISYYYPSPTN